MGGKYLDALLQSAAELYSGVFWYGFHCHDIVTDYTPFPNFLIFLLDLSFQKTGGFEE